MEWLNIELSSWDAAMVVQSWLIYKMVTIKKDIPRKTIQIALIYFLGPALLANLLLRIGLNISQG